MTKVTLDFNDDEYIFLKKHAKIDERSLKGFIRWEILKKFNYKNGKKE